MKKKIGVEAEFQMTDVCVVYDVHYELKNNIKGDATFLIKFDDIVYFMSLSNEKNNKMQGKIAFLATNSRGQYFMEVKTYPNNKYEQIIVRHVRIKSKVHFSNSKFQFIAIKQMR